MEQQNASMFHHPNGVDHSQIDYFLIAKSATTDCLLNVLDMARNSSDHNPPIMNPFNYCGITITMVLCNVLKMIIKQQIGPILIPSQNSMKTGFMAGSSPLLASLMLQEARNEAINYKLPLYTAFLDAK